MCIDISIHLAEIDGLDDKIKMNGHNPPRVSPGNDLSIAVLKVELEMNGHNPSHQFQPSVWSYH